MFSPDDYGELQKLIFNQ